MAFAMGLAPVINDAFAAFVDATGHETEAERLGWSAVFGGLLPDPGDLGDRHRPRWWRRVEGASWRAPEGPGSDLVGRGDHPAVHVSWSDARAYATWAGGRLPSEAEWEHAGRGGLEDPRFPWGDEEPTDTLVRANVWQGRFPDGNALADGWLGTSPIGAFAPNGAGLHDVAGNVWEWTADAFRVRSLGRAAKARNAAARRGGERVVKGGSFLCHPSYCYRYRIAARQGLPPDSSASNLGFRVAWTV